jgi:hypothetical protein
MNEGRLRVRAVLGRWFAAVVVVALVAAAFGVVLTYGAHAAPGTHEEQRTVDEWSVRGSFTHGATVTDAANGTVFESGTVVRNRTVYFQRVMPVLEGEFAFAVRDAGAPVDVRIRRQLVVRSVEPEGREETPRVYWQENRTLGRTETTVESGERTTVPFSVDVAQTVREARNVSERLGSPGQIQTHVAVTVTATRQRSGAETHGRTYTLPIDPTASTYRVEAEPDSETFTQTETVTVANDPGPLKSVGGPLLLLAGLLGTAVLAVSQHRGLVGLADRERRWLAYRDDRADFEEWITTVRLPEEAKTLPVAEAETLADLVDLAIDTDSAVVESPDGRTYSVLHGGYRYAFEAPSDPSSVPEGDGDDAPDRHRKGDAAESRAATGSPNGDVQTPSGDASASAGSE